MSSEHTSKQFEAELETVRSSVLRMGGLVEEQVANAMEALVAKRTDLAEMVINKSHQVKAMEVEIDKDCAQILARRQPTAGDLRLVMTVIKTINDLERIGDGAEKIANMSRQIYQAERLSSPRFGEIRLMSSIVLDMLHKSLNAFARLDIGSVHEVANQDIQVDEAYRSFMRHMVTCMMEDPRSISTSIKVLFAAKAIERIGDHSKNMSEYVVYLVKGKAVRHTTFQEIGLETV